MHESRKYRYHNRKIATLVRTTTTSSSERMTSSDSSTDATDNQSEFDQLLLNYNERGHMQTEAMDMLMTHTNSNSDQQQQQQQQQQDLVQELWLCDSGSSYHIVPSEEDFDPGTMVPCSVSLRIGDNSQIQADTMGQCTRKTQEGQMIIMRNVLLSPNCPTKILAIGKLTKPGTATFLQNKHEVKLITNDNEAKLILKGQLPCMVQLMLYLLSQGNNRKYCSRCRKNLKS